jgi:hypothetical protein
MHRLAIPSFALQHYSTSSEPAATTYNPRYPVYRPLGICSRFADWGPSVFVIDGALPPVLPHRERPRRISPARRYFGGA